jgi:hypothetical protein
MRAPDRNNGRLASRPGFGGRETVARRIALNKLCVYPCFSGLVHRREITAVTYLSSPTRTSTSIWRLIEDFPSRNEVLIILAVFLLFACSIYFLFAEIDQRIYFGAPPMLEAEAGEDVWFDADTFTAYSNLTDWKSNHYRSDMHPLHSIFTAPIVSIFKMVGFSNYEAVRLFVSLSAGVWICAFFVLLRSIGIALTDRIVFSCLLASSASAIFMAPVAELFLLGSLTLMLPFYPLAAQARRQYISASWYIAASTATLSLTVTNWMAGVIATLISNPLPRAIKITVYAFLTVVLLWMFEKVLFPSAFFFLPDPTGHLFTPSLNSYRDRVWMPALTAAGLVDRALVFFCHAMVMPAIQLTLHREHEELDWPSINVMHSPVASAGTLSSIATILWILLLALGLWALARGMKGKHALFCIALALTLLGQFVLHLKFGTESFLYSLHWVPLLVAMTALATLTPFRRVALLMAGVIALTGGANNYLQFRTITPLVIPDKSVWMSKVNTYIEYKMPRMSKIN